MTTSATINPAFALLESKLALVQLTRARLLARVSDVSPDLAIVLEEFFERRIVGSSTPPIGEAWPWLLADVAGLDSNDTCAVAEACLAVYVYTAMLDRQCDDPDYRASPHDVLAMALLFEIGLGDLTAVVQGTPWLHVLRSSIRDAIRGQVGDVRLQANIAGFAEKSAYAEGKNGGLVMAAAAVAGIAKRDPAALVTFAKTVRLAFQHLDDIADFEIDLRARNFTPLLAESCAYFPELGNDFQTAPRDEMLRAMVLSGALEKVLLEARALLARAREDLGRAFPDVGTSTAGVSFLSHLERELGAIIGTVGQAGRELENPKISPAEESHVLGHLQLRLLVVAQQS